MSDAGHDPWNTRAREEVVGRGDSPAQGEGPSGAELGEVMPSMQELAEHMVAQAKADGVDITGEGGLLTELMRKVLESGLEAEMEEHLGYLKHAKGRAPATPETARRASA